MRRQSHPVVDHVSACQRSGLTVGEYCRQAGISHATYSYRRTRQREGNVVVPRRVPGPSTVPFLEIGPRPASTHGYALRFHRVGVDLLVCRGFEAAEVTALARVAASLYGADVGC